MSHSPEQKSSHSNQGGSEVTAGVPQLSHQVTISSSSGSAILASSDGNAVADGSHVPFSPADILAIPGMMQGVVKWFNDAKGFGFIEHESGRDVFVHYSVIETEGFKTLKDGETVFYSLAEGDKGLHAGRVLRDPNVVKATVKTATKAKVGVNPETSPEERSLHHQIEVENIGAPRADDTASFSGASKSQLGFGHKHSSSE